jgi:hypothetical protein
MAQVLFGLLGLAYTGFICSGPILLTYVLSNNLNCITKGKEKNCIDKKCIATDKKKKMTIVGIILVVISLIIYMLKAKRAQGKIMLVFSAICVALISLGYNLMGPIMLSFVGSTIYKCIKNKDDKCIKHDCIFNIKNGVLIIAGIIFTFLSGGSPIHDYIGDYVPSEMIATLIKMLTFSMILFGCVLATWGGVTKCYHTREKQGGCQTMFIIGIVFLIVVALANIGIAVIATWKSSIPSIKQIGFIYFLIAFGSIMATWGGVTKCYKKREDEKIGGCKISFIIGIVMLILVSFFYIVMFAMGQFF